MSGLALHLPAPVARAIRFEAFLSSRRLRRYGYDPQDVHQDLLLHWWRRRRSHDGHRSSEATFASRACRHRAIQITEAALAAKRGGAAMTVSLSDEVFLGDEGETVSIMETISADRVNLVQGQQSRPAAEEMALCLDIDRITAGLPRELAVVVQLLSDGETPSEIARHLGISRATLHRRVMRLRQLFQAAGLDRYTVAREVA